MIPTYLGGYSQSNDESVQHVLGRGKAVLSGLSQSGVGDGDEMHRLTGCLSDFDRKLVKNTPSPEALEDALAQALPETVTESSVASNTGFLESGVVVHARQGQR